MWNSGMMTKLKRLGGWQKTDVSSLRVGNIIKIEQNAICPADVLILDSSDSRLTGKFVMINEGKLTGIQKVSRKMPIRNLSKFEEQGIGAKVEDLRSQMTGFIEY